MCCVMLVAATTVLAAAKDQTIHARRGTNRVDVVLASTRIEIAPESGEPGSPSSLNYGDLQCARYTKLLVPLGFGWGPLDLLASVGRKIKNVVARDTIEHFIDLVPKMGEQVRLKISDSDVSTLNAGLMGAGVPSCNGNATIAAGLTSGSALEPEQVRRGE
jgi:hypothetical protein